MFRRSKISSAGTSHARRSRVLLLIALGWMLAGCGFVGSDADAPEARTVELFFATTRAVEDKGRFGRDRGDLSFGIADVAIPPNHVIGRNEQPSMFRFEWSENERKHIALRGTETLDDDTFLQQLNAAIDRSPERRLMIFVHGYNVDFPEAARGLAQFSTDLKFDGPVLLFSWPSQDSLMSYAVDATNADWSQTHLTRVLTEVLDRTDAAQIVLIAHSMGSATMTRAYITIASERPLDIYRVQQMILVAPDMDADIFRHEVAPRLARAYTPVTLYASSGDRALMASKTFNGYPRAGDSGRGLVVVPGVETVDASDASRGFLGHSYFMEDRRIMEDIYAILTSGQRSDSRFGLEAVDTPEGRYWTFRR
jgi:esterase/lipase superfamily enzyme